MSISHKAKSTLGIPRRKAPRNDMTADKLDSDLILKKDSQQDGVL